MDLKLPGRPCVPPPAYHPHRQGWHQWGPCPPSALQRMSWYFAWSHSTANKVFLSCSCFARLKCLIFIPARQESQVVFTLCILKWNDWANIFILVRVRLLNKLSLEVVLLGQRCICQGVFLTGTPLQALGIIYGNLSLFAGFHWVGLIT